MNNCTLHDPMVAQRYYDGELPRADAARFEAHLATCGPCRSALEAWETAGASLRAVFPPEMPAGLTTRFVRRAREKQLQHSRRIAFGLLAAASVLLASSLFLVGYSKTGPHGAPVIGAPWEEFVLAAPDVEDEFSDLESRTLVAIHVRKAPASENGND